MSTEEEQFMALMHESLRAQKDCASIVINYTCYNAHYDYVDAFNFTFGGDSSRAATFTSSKLATTDYQRLTEALVQIRNAISILNVINQQISRNIRVMLFLFFLVLFYIFPSFAGAKVQKYFI